MIVALVEAVVIAESDVDGGAMIAARSALEQGRNLFAMKWHDMEAPARAGTRRLLEARLARPVGESTTEIPFDQHLFQGSGGPVSKAMASSVPQGAQSERLRRSWRHQVWQSGNGTNRPNQSTEANNQSQKISIPDAFLIHSVSRQPWLTRPSSGIWTVS